MTCGISWEGLSGKGPFEQTPEGYEAGVLQKIWRKISQEEGTASAKALMQQRAKIFLPGRTFPEIQI